MSQGVSADLQVPDYQPVSVDHDRTIAAEVRVDHDRLPFRTALRGLPNVTIVPDYRASDGQRDYQFVSVRADSYDRIERAFAADPTVSDPVVVDRTETERVYRVEWTDQTMWVGGALAAVGGRIVDEKATATGWTLSLKLPSRKALVAFNDRCKRRDVSVNVSHLRMDTGEDDPHLGLTAKQQRLLTVALEEGYFDVPRGISQDELAERFDVSKSAISQRLRRALGELCESALTH